MYAQCSRELLNSKPILRLVFFMSYEVCSSNQTYFKEQLDPKFLWVCVLCIQLYVSLDDCFEGSYSIFKAQMLN